MKTRFLFVILLIAASVAQAKPALKPAARETYSRLAKVWLPGTASGDQAPERAWISGENGYVQGVLDDWKTAAMKRTLKARSVEVQGWVASDSKAAAIRQIVLSRLKQAGYSCRPIKLLYKPYEGSVEVDPEPVEGFEARRGGLTIAAVWLADYSLFGSYLLLAWGECVPQTPSQLQNDALISAIKIKSVARVQALLARGADANAADYDGATALNLAVSSDSTTIVQQLLDHHAHFNDGSLDGAAALIAAASLGNAATVDLLLNRGVRGVPVNAVSKGRTALMAAAQAGADKVVQQLLDQGANIDAQGADGQTALMWAAWAGYHDSGGHSAPEPIQHRETVEMLLSRGADVNLRDRQGETALLKASQDDYAGLAPLLVNRGANVNLRNKNGQPALMLAASGGVLGAANVPLMQLLLEHGAEVNARTADSQTALMRVSLRYDLKGLRLLLEHGADARARDNQGKGMLVHSLERTEGVRTFKEAASLLLAKGARVNEPDKRGNTALMLASGRQDLVAVQWLLEHGAEAAARRQDGVTAFMIASHSDFIGEAPKMAIMALLMRHGADVNAAMRDGQTALMLAALNDRTSTVKWLLDHGANPNSQTSAGNTALMKMADNVWDPPDVTLYTQIIPVLLSKGARLDLRNKKGQTVLMLATARGHKEIVKILKQAGAKQ